MKNSLPKKLLLQAAIVSCFLTSLNAEDKLDVIRSSMSQVQVRLSAEGSVAGLQMTLHGFNARFSAPRAIGTLQETGWIFSFNQINDSTTRIVILGGSMTQNLSAGSSFLFECAVSPDPARLTDSTSVWLSDVVLVDPATNYIVAETSPAAWTNARSLASDSFSSANASLIPNYPNPFNPSTNLTYRINAAGQSKLAIYDMLGRELKVIVDGFQHAGEYSATWNSDSDTGEILSSGTYFAVLTVEGSRSIQKMVLKK